MQLHKHTIKNVIAFCIFLALVIFNTYPLIFHLGDYTIGFGDELVITWIQNWVIHALTSDPLHLFTANLYFPYQNTLAYSDLFLTTSVLALIPARIIGEPIVTFNVTLISSLVLLGFSLYLLSHYLTKNFFASIFCGIIVIFSPALLDKATHLQILAVEGVPLAVLFYLRYLDSKKVRYFAVSLFFFLLQTYNSFLPGYFILFSYLILTGYYWLYKKIKMYQLFQKKTVFLVLLTGILLLPIIIPYYQVSREFNYTRDIRDAVHLALQPEDLLYPSRYTRLESSLLALPIHQKSQNNEFKPGYIGGSFLVLLSFCGVYLVRKIHKKDMVVHSFWTIAITGLVTSLGPVLHFARQTVHWPFLIPLPYLVFYYVLPGFKGFRNSARWEVLFIIMAAVGITLVLVKCLKRFSPFVQRLVFIFLMITCIVESAQLFQFFTIEKKEAFPEVYQWLQNIPEKSAVIIMPAYNWNMKHADDEILREYYSIINFKKTVNGYSGFSPPAWQELLIFLRAHFPDQQSINELRKLGISYVVIDKAGYDKNFITQQVPYNATQIMQLLTQNTELNLVKNTSQHAVFTFREQTCKK